MKKIIPLLLITFACLSVSYAQKKNPSQKSVQNPPQKESRAKTKKIKKQRQITKNSKVDSILEALIRAQGGKKALSAVKKIYGFGRAEMVTPIGELRGKFKFYQIKPDFHRIEITIRGVHFIQSFYPGGGWIQQGPAIIPAPKAQLESVKNDIMSTELELRYKKEKIPAFFKGIRKINGKKVYSIEFRVKKMPVEYYIDAENYLLIRKKFRASSPLGAGKVNYETIFEDYRWVNLSNSKARIRIPFVTKTLLNGKKALVIRAEKIEINSDKVKKHLFYPPSPVE